MDHSSSHSTSSNAADPYPEPRLFCPLEGNSPAERVTRREQALEALGLLESESIPIFEEAVQMAARFLHLPICTLSIVSASTEHFKAALGLSQLGLMNPLAKSRQIKLLESFGAYVLDSEQPCVLADVSEHPAFVSCQIVQTYGVRAYAGVPLITSQGCCIGVLAVMDRQPHPFSQQQIAFLELTARWSISEYERNQLQAHQETAVGTEVAPGSSATQQPESVLRSLIDSVRLTLIGQLTQELRNPLTSVMGMASMLSREIYGPLTDKQREYTDIVRSSSQTLMALVDEIIELGALDESYQQLVPASIDIEMLGQQVLKTLEQIAEKHEQQLLLTVEPGPRLWVLDKGKVKQLLYHLIFSVIQMAGESSVVRLHASRRSERLNLTISLSNPWLGEGLPQSLVTLGNLFLGQARPHLSSASELGYRVLGQAEDFWHRSELRATDETDQMPECSRELLGLLLSRHLAELHGGSITVQGTPEAGYRFVVSLPALVSASRMMEFTT